MFFRDSRIDDILFDLAHPDPVAWYSTQMGWECPRCHSIHAPHVSTCNCKLPRDMVVTDTPVYSPESGMPTPPVITQIKKV